MLGLTVTEILVSLAVSTIILTGVISFYTLSVKVSKETLNGIRLVQELTLVADVMTNEIQRSGYWSNAASDIGSDQLRNPFMSSSTDIQFNSNNDCILFSYDANGDGILPNVGAASDDRFGFRLHNNAIQYRVSGAEFSCSGSDAQWINLTDPNVINVSALHFVKNVGVVDLEGNSVLNLREIVVTITANLSSEPTVSRTFSRTVKVYNNAFIP
jgi:type II secretory pathway component PulJ